jgi:hypothetical protein
MTFPLGRVVITRAALWLAQEAKADPLDLVLRHATEDWGDLGHSDKAANKAALKHGGRIFSAYDWHGQRWYVITEHDRSYTTVMLASDY